MESMCNSVAMTEKGMAAVVGRRGRGGRGQIMGFRTVCFVFWAADVGVDFTTVGPLWGRDKR